MDDQKSVSMRDIARLAGVSIATVSRVINNNGRFSEETRERVQRIIDENGYVTNMAAKSLREQRSKTIGMIVPDISNDFFSTLALRAEQELAREGYSVFVCNTANSTNRERTYIRTLVSKRVDGILCISGSNVLAEESIPKSIPVVCVDRFPGTDSNVPRVISDDVNGGHLATQHLIERGCRHILVISSACDDLNKRNREKGYRQALEMHDLAVDPAYRVLLPGDEPSMVETERLVTSFLTTGLPLDGIFALSDHAALGALRALKLAGIRSPEDVKIVGFDNSIYTLITTPSITTVRRFPQTLASRGCEALLSYIAGTRPPLEVVVPVELVERDSTRGTFDSPMLKSQGPEARRPEP